MFEVIENGQIFLVTEVQTKTQTAIVKTYYGMIKKIKIQTQKTVLAVNEQVDIQLLWQKFDLSARDWLYDTTNNDPIKLDIDGVKEELQPLDGTDTLIFSSAEPGPVIIRTENPGVDNTTLEVTVNA